mgnify:FL=1
MEGTMRRLTDKNWKVLAPLLPKRPRRKRLGRPPVLTDRQILEGIWYVVTSGIPWNDLPSRYGSGTTCWRRLKRWQKDGTWQRIWEKLLVILDQRGILDWDHTVLDSADMPAKKGDVVSAGRTS